MQTLDFGSTAMTLADRVAADLPGFAGGHGHPDFPCLSRTHNPSSCVPCVDFSPWLRERVRRRDVEAVGEYLWRVREANPGVGELGRGLPPALSRRWPRLLMQAPLDRYLLDGTEEAMLELRVALVLLAVHEGFSGFIMTGEAADFWRGRLSPRLQPHRRGRAGRGAATSFVSKMASEMSYWATWPASASPTPSDPVVPPSEPRGRGRARAAQPLPLGVRAHAADALRHLSADPSAPRTLASLSRYETRKRGLEVAESVPPDPGDRTGRARHRRSRPGSPAGPGATCSASSRSAASGRATPGARSGSPRWRETECAELLRSA